MLPEDHGLRPPEPRASSRGEPHPSNGGSGPGERPAEQPPEPRASDQGNVERVLVNMLTEQIARADHAVQDRAQAILEAERGRVALQAAQDAAEAAARTAAAALEEVERFRAAEAARKARGRLARLRAAWRGE